jgi:hypothetical protein
MRLTLTSRLTTVARVTDITYLATDEGWLYLAAIVDCYNRRWSAGPPRRTGATTCAPPLSTKRSSDGTRRRDWSTIPTVVVSTPATITKNVSEIIT